MLVLVSVVWAMEIVLKYSAVYALPNTESQYYVTAEVFDFEQQCL